MKIKKLTISILALAVAIVCDVIIRVFYCSGVAILFNSTEFNNIATPIISFFGFIGLIITVRIALNQFKLQLSSDYFKYYREILNKLLEESTKDSATTINLLDFPSYSNDRYNELLKYPEYFTDLAIFKNGGVVHSQGKGYDKDVLGKVRVFRASIGILLKRYQILTEEILYHKSIDNSHKDLLLKEFFNNQVLNYVYGLRFLEMDEDLKIVKDNLYIGFSNIQREQFQFYDSSFYELKKKMDSNIKLQKYLKGND